MKKTFLAILAIAAITSLAACNNKQQAKANSQSDIIETQDSAKEATGESYNLPIRDTDRNETTLDSEIAKNKLTVVDFWASWCGPCRHEMPNVVKLYQEFAGKGLGIIGISLDEDNSAWQGAIKVMNMTWPQYSDLRGWDDGCAQHFGIRAIPHTIIFDEKGNIVAQGLRGDMLRTFVAERLN